MTTSIEQRLIQWFLFGDTGTSSRTIATVLSGNYPPKFKDAHPFDYDIPHDPSDLGRCLRLLDLIPEWEPRLAEVVALFPEWGPLVTAWTELKEGYAEESPTGRCPLLYKRMREIREECDHYRESGAVTEGEFRVNPYALTARHLPTDIRFWFERKGRSYRGALDTRHGPVKINMPVREFTLLLKQADKTFKAVMARHQQAADGRGAAG